MNPSSEPLRRVAAICYRRNPSGIEFLLVRTTENKWTFPKGMIDEGFTPSQAAEMEAWEEGGVRGRIEAQPLGEYRYLRAWDDEPAEVEFQVTAYLLDVQQQEPAPESFRTPAWFTASSARQALCERRTTEQSAELLRILALAVESLERN